MQQKIKDYKQANADPLCKGARVWIELERPPYELPAEERQAIAEERATLASAMLERLGCNAGFVHWDNREGRYCYGGAMGYVTATDDGHWFNLRFMAGQPAN